MGEKIKEVTGIASWMWAIIIPTFITLMSFTVSATAKVQKMDSAMEQCKEDITELHNEKASNEKVDIMFETIQDIDKKVDELLKAM